MKNWKELLASFGLWLLVEDISDDGDGKGDNLQLTKDGELFVSEIQQELDRAREEVIKNLIKKIEEANCDSISLEFLREIDLSKLTTK